MRLFSNTLRRYLCLLLAALLLCSGCSPSAVSENENVRFENFTNLLFSQEVSSNTLTLHYTLKDPAKYNITDIPAGYSNFPVSPTDAMASAENLSQALRQFSYNNLDETNQLTYDILDSYFRTNQALAPYLLYQEPVNPATGIQAQLPVLLSEYRFYSTADVDTYLELLTQTPDYFESLAAFETAKAKKGLFMSSTAAENVISQCNTFLKMGDMNYLYTTFAERLDALPELTSGQREDYLFHNKTIVDTCVLPAFRYFVSVMDALKDSGKNDKGLYYLPDGVKYYEALVAHDTGSSRTIPELQRLTKRQILSDLTAMKNVLSSQQSVPPETSSDVNPLFADPDAILNSLKSRYTSAFPKGPAVETTVKYVPKPLEKFLSPAFYLIPAIDDSSENVIYINRGQTTEGIELYTTLAHEGYPGHLYQTTYFTSTHPNPVRSILSFGGYTEGWATYTEMMSYYMAPIPREQALILQKNHSAILGLYALADMGIHHDGWTPETTESFFKNYGITDTSTVKNIYSMILSDPGNYLKYYIGYLEFLELKRACAARDGKHFSQKKFHQTILETGPAPFAVLKKRFGL